MSVIRIDKRRFVIGAAAAGVFLPAIGARAQATVLRWGDGQAPTHPSPQSAARAAKRLAQAKRGLDARERRAAGSAAGLAR